MARRGVIPDDIYGVRSRKTASDDSPETGFRHSAYYHNYFRGYTELRRERPGGKYSIERTYTAPWVTLSRPRRWAAVVYPSLSLGSAALFTVVMTRPGVEGNTARLVAAAGFPSFILLFLLLAVTAMYLARPKKMTLWEQNSTTKRLKAVSLAAAVCLALTALLMLARLLSGGAADPMRELAAALGVLLSALASATLYFLERRAKYIQIPNDTALPEGEKHKIW